MTGWPLVTLADCCHIVSGATPKTSVEEYWDGDIDWVTPKDLSGLDGAYIRRTPRRITQAGLASCGANILPPQSVLFSSRAPIGHVAINTVPMATNQGFKSLIPHPNRVEAKYLYYWLRANRSYLEGLGNGATFKEVSKAIVSRVEIPVPPLGEQRKIAAILDQADALRTKRREALAHLDDLTQSIFFDMFVRGGSGDWPLVTVDQVAAPTKGSIRTGPFGSQLLHSEFVDEGVAVLGIDNAVSNEFKWRDRRFITEEKYSKLSRYTVHPGDVLITIMGTCGRCAVVPDDVPVAINTKHLCCITVNRDVCLPEFVHASFLRHPTARAYLQRTAKGAIMSGLNMAIIKGMPLAVPPLELQARFARRVDAVQASRNVHDASRDELDSLFASLQSRAFAGEL